MDLVNLLNQIQLDGKRAHHFHILSTLCLKRNIKRELFPHKQSAQQGKNLLNEIESYLLSSLHGIIKLEFNKLSPEEKKLFFCGIFYDSSLFEDRPCQEVFFLKEKNLFIFINIDNHLTFYVMENDLLKGKETLYFAENLLAKKFDYAFCPNFGFITYEDKNLGNGLEIKSYYHLPAIKEVKTTLINNGIILTEAPPLILLKNGYNLGISVDEIFDLQLLEEKKICAEQEHLRKNLQGLDQENFKSDLAKAFGTLLYGYQLKKEEILSSLSLIKQGIDLSLISGISDDEISKLLFQSMRIVNQEQAAKNAKELILKGSLKF